MDKTKYPDLKTMTTGNRKGYVYLVLTNEIEDDRFEVKGNNIFFCGFYIGEAKEAE